MAYLLIEDFRFGLDARRGSLTALPGTLRQLTNAVVNRGGEIEKRKGFFQRTADLRDTFGLVSDGRKQYVFGQGARPSTLPPQFDFVDLTLPSNPNQQLRTVVDTIVYGGLIYVVAEYDNGEYAHFYDGRLVQLAPDLKFGPTVAVLSNKVYSAQGTSFMYSPVDDPSRLGVDDDLGGFIDVSRTTGRAEDMRTVAIYQNEVIVMGDHSALLYDVNADAERNTLIQRFDNLTSVAPRTAQMYGSRDVFFLSRSGVQSLRARDSSNFSAVSNVGDPVDTLILQAIAQLTTDEITRDVMALVDPSDGRYWLVIDREVYVFTAFPGSGIAAWSKFALPFKPTGFACESGRLYLRDAESLYLYGGDDGNSYDDTEVVVRTPFHDAQQAAHQKAWDGVDVSVTGEWQIGALTYANREDVVEPVGWTNQHTYCEKALPLRAVSSHMALEMRSKHFGPAVLHNAALHFETAPVTQ